MLNNDQVDILITKFFSGEASPEEAMLLEDWVSISATNKDYVDSASKIFPTNIGLTSTHNKTHVWENIKDTVSKNKPVARAKVVNWRVAGVAASIVLLVAIGLLLNNVYKKENNEILYQAGSSSKKVSLKDGSEIVVSPNSSITIYKGYGNTNRKIKLNGSAFFSVIHDSRQSFIIDMNSLHIRDIGTKFTVVTCPTGDTVFINVFEGKISVYDDFGSSQNVSAGQNIIYTKTKKRLQVLPIVQTPGSDTTIRRNSHSLIPQPLSAVDDYPYNSYSSQYPLNESYTPEGKRAITQKDSIETAKIIADMLKDGLISSGQPLSFKLSNTEFIINGKTQDDAIFQRYKKKYVPHIKGGEGWIWSHNFNDPPVKH